jgi:hypothetical protein
MRTAVILSSGDGVDDMKIQFLVDLSRNLQSLITKSGLTTEEYAKEKRLPKKMLEELLACHQSGENFAASLAVVADKLGLSAAQLLSPELSNAAANQSPVGESGAAAPDRLLARQLGRLIEDFVECDEAGRFEVTALAQELAEEQLRRIEREPGHKSSKASP